MAWLQKSDHICASKSSLLWSSPPTAPPSSQCSMNWPSRGILASHFGHLPFGKSGQAPTKANQKASRPHVQYCESSGIVTNQSWICSDSWDQWYESVGSKLCGNGRNGMGISMLSQDSAFPLSLKTSETWNYWSCYINKNKRWSHSHVIKRKRTPRVRVSIHRKSF